MKLRSTAVIFAASALLLAACGDGDAGQPTTQPTVDVAKPSTANANVSVPPVSDPIQNLDPFEQNPCSLLTKRQADSIGFPKSEDATEAGQPGCRWHGNRDSRITIAIQSGEKWSLAGYYQVHANDPDAYGYFEPASITGFPAVFATEFDRRETGSCAMTVALSEQDVLRLVNTLFLGTAQRDNPCAQLQQTAELAVKTISAGK